MTENNPIESNQAPLKEPGLLQRLKESLNFRKMTVGQAAFTLLFLAIIGIMVYIYVVTYLGVFTDDAIGDSGLLTGILLNFFIIPVRDMQEWGILLFLGIMLLQCIIAPIPSEFVQIIGGLLFGIWLGGFLSYGGIMITAFLGYYIANKGGAKVIGAAVGEKNVKAMERFIGKYGIWAMILGRGIPYIPFDLVTYGSGLVKMGKKDYVIGTLIGTAPRSFFYSYMGSLLFGGSIDTIYNEIVVNHVPIDTIVDQVSGDFNLVLSIIMLVVLAGFAVFYFVILPNMRKKAAKEANQLPPQAPV